MWLEGQLFEYEPRLVDDVYAFSATIDSLVEGRVSLEDFLVSVASELNRVVEGRVFGQRLRSLPGGPLHRLHIDPEQLTLATADVDVRIDPPLPGHASRFIRQRLVHAVKLIAHYDGSTQISRDVSDQIRALFSALGPEDRRAEIRRLLGLATEPQLTVVAVAGAGGHPERAERLAAGLSGGAPVLSAHVGGVLGVILRQPPALDVGVPKGLSVGIGEPVDPERLHESWKGATTALRFTLPSRRARGPYREFDAVIVDIRRVGSLRVLAESVSQAGVEQLADVRGIRKLAEIGLPDSLAVLEAVAATESIRQAAQLVHMHHNTVAQRVEAAEDVLGFSFRENYGRTRLLVGLTLHRLSFSREGEPGDGVAGDGQGRKPRTQLSSRP